MKVTHYNGNFFLVVTQLLFILLTKIIFFITKLTKPHIRSEYFPVLIKNLNREKIYHNKVTFSVLDPDTS